MSLESRITAFAQAVGADIKALVGATAANAAQLLGKTWAAPDPIGSTTPNTGKFTSLTSTGGYTQSADYSEIRFRAASSANLNGWRLATMLNGVNDGDVVLQHSTDNFSTNFSTPIRFSTTGYTGFGTLPLSGSTSGLTIGSDITLSGAARAIFGNMYYLGGWKYAGAGRAGCLKWGTTDTDVFSIAVCPNNAGGAGATATPVVAVAVEADGALNFGTPSAITPLGYAKPRMSVASADTHGVVASYNTNAAFAATFNLAHVQNNTVGGQAATVANAALGGVGFWGSDGTSLIQAAAIRCSADGASTSGNLPGRVGVYTSAAGASHERLRFDSGGGILGITTSGIGYGIGAGGTVLQATSKTTAVTLNKPNGQITTHNAALAAGAAVSFLVNNSLVTTSDRPEVVMQSGGISGVNYNCWVGAVVAGGFYVCLKNISAGSLSEALILNFGLGKGSVS